MYKPNGEERMSWQEEKKRRDSLEQHRLERLRSAPIAETLKTSLYSLLARSTESRDDGVRLGAEGNY